MMRHWFAVLSYAVCAACSGAPAFRIAVLPAGLGRAVAMNNRGQVLFRGSTRSFIWDSGSVTCLQDHGFTGSAKAINDRGEVAGESGWVDRFVTDVRKPQKHALLWRGGATTDLGVLKPLLAPYARSWANGINNAGWVVGTADGPDGPICPFLWKDGTMLDLRGKGDSAGIANSLSDKGVVVGSICRNGSSSLHAFLWEDGTGHDLRTLGGPSGTATAVNQRGFVVGFSDTPTAQTQAFLWRNGKMTMLERPKGFTTTTATSINDTRDIVGTATRYSLDKDNVRNDESRAVLWRNGKVLDLNALIPDGARWKLTGAITVNNAGVVLATGSKGGMRGWLLLIPATKKKGGLR